MNASVFVVEQLLAFAHDGDIHNCAKYFTLLEQPVSPQGNHDGRFVAMLFDVVVCQGPLLPSGNGRSCHESAQ